MSKVFRTLAVALPLVLLTPSCQKETINVNEFKTDQMSEKKLLFYTIDGKDMSMVVTSEAAWQSFLKQMVCLAENGHSVKFRIGSNSVRQVGAKEKLTYTTPSQSDAQNWCDQKAKDGYEVSMEYDPITKIYTCTAVKD